ncbi:chemotaxis protein CheW [Anaerovorax sp. IOR16]|uniref:chemotaxis protein CheW n=1 Tax=Anaerovorax sp. IOR16 TaxID=2773458 RepID=UPI0019CF548F|nr:chemotaxis protein CheW [Anaerovorax sp. IOR16]
MQQEIQSNQDIITKEIPWIVFKAGHGVFAISSEIVSSISILSKEITGMPEAPSYVRGLVNLRDGCIPVVDLRSVLNMQTLEEEIRLFESMLEERKQDHQKWASELVRSINQKEPFTLTSDPHQCAFGKWYDSYKTENPMVQFHLKKIDEPHKKLHNMAVRLQDALDIPNEEERMKALDDIQKQLQDEILPIMLRLLDETKQVMGESVREMMLVLDDGQKQGGIAVDEVLRVEHLEPMKDTIKIDEYHQMNFVTGVSRSKEQIILLIDEKKLIELI